MVNEVRNIVPVVFVPGTAGSYLYYKSVNRDNMAWLPVPGNSNDFDALNLNSSGAGPDTKNGGKEIDVKEGSKGVITTFASRDVYGSLQTKLKDVRGEENLTTFYCPWDWRKQMKSGENEELKTLLKKVYLNSGSNQVDIVSHSQGCLFTRSYLLEYGNSNYGSTSLMPQIRRWVAVGEPTLGSYRTAQALSFGYNFDIPIYSDASLKPMAKNAPCIYNQFPAKQLLDEYGNFTDKSGWTNDKFTKNIGFNNGIYGSAYNGKQFQSWVLNNKIPSNIEYFKIVGTGTPTCRFFTTTKQIVHGVPVELDIADEIEFINGDKTVPLASSDVAQIVNNPDCDFGAEIWYTNAGHVDLCKGQQLKLIMELLEKGSTYNTEYYRKKNGNNYYPLSGTLMYVPTTANVEVNNELGENIYSGEAVEGTSIWLTGGHTYQVNINGLEDGDQVRLVEFAEDEKVNEIFVNASNTSISNPHGNEEVDKLVIQMEK